MSFVFKKPTKWWCLFNVFFSSTSVSSCNSDQISNSSWTSGMAEAFPIPSFGPDFPKREIGSVQKTGRRSRTRHLPDIFSGSDFIKLLIKTHIFSKIKRLTAQVFHLFYFQKIKLMFKSLIYFYYKFWNRVYLGLLSELMIRSVKI